MATSDNGDWNKYGKYCGTTSNPMAKYAPLANINFPKKIHPMIRTSLPMFPNSNQKKENMEWSLEEWAFLILKLMLKHAYDADEENERHWNRTSNMRSPFFISNIDLRKMVGMYQKCHLLHLWIQMQTGSMTCQKMSWRWMSANW